MINSSKREFMLKNVAAGLLSMPPLLFREIRSKLVKTTLADTEVNISPLNYEIMSLLEDTGTVNITRIGKELSIAPAQLTEVIEKLVNLNMVERKSNRTDRRTANISLTQHGKVFLDARKERLNNIVIELMSSLQDEELEELSDTLRNLENLLLRLQKSVTLL